MDRWPGCDIVRLRIVMDGGVAYRRKFQWLTEKVHVAGRR